MRSLAMALLLCASPLAASTPRPDLLPPAGRRIVSIKIESNNVFDTEAPPENKLLYRAANDIHIRTRERIISRELLFEIGDRFDPALAEESERNLRALPFIRRAKITAAINPRGAVDVLVRTYDSWSLEVVASFKRAGGSTSIRAGVAEHNVLGEGKLVSAVFNRDGLIQSKSFGYQDPQFLHTQHLPFAFSATESPGIENYALSLNRPFYASIAPWAAGGTATYVKSGVPIYDGQVLLGTVSKSIGEAGIGYGVAVATSTERTRRVTFGVLAHRAEYTAIAGGAPPADLPGTERMGFLQLGGDFETLDFITVRRIQKFTRDEDYNLGLAVLPVLAWAPFVRALGSTRSEFVPGVTATKGFAWADQLLFLNAGYGAKYVNGFDSNRIVSLGATYYVRGLPRQTWAFHSAVDLGWHVDPAAPLVLGEANGLRGYGLNAFSGDRRFLFNVEDRIFVWDELFRLLDVGTVVFYDSGYAWSPGARTDMADLRNSAGMGLRLAPSRSADNSPVRIDAAYALSSNQTRSRWSLSILAGQAFQ